MSLTEPKKNGVYKTKWSLRKIGQQLGFKKKNWGKVKKIGYLGYKKKKRYK